jgi:hypothetical protein
VQLPVISIEPGTDPSFELVTSLVVERLFTIPITCYYDRRAHEVTDENIAAGRRSGHYEALCGYRVIAAAMAAPAGRPCPECVAVLVAARSLAVPARRGRHRRLGWLSRVMRPVRSGSLATAGEPPPWLPHAHQPHRVYERQASA